uniref:Regulator Ustilago maydis 1 protein n=1 Tax=Ganoderma boninense TaxID=34458 RepID=A0A5K1K293_9APHY|nr:Regulator Ustilago maydis 1 protein [Ganoderma boninense]
MSLTSGQYYITTADGGFPIGRRLAEDRSLLPKGIFKLPLGTESVPPIADVSPPFFPLPPFTFHTPVFCVVRQWDVEKLDNGNYKLRNRGAIVGGTVGHLFAFLMEDGAATVTTEWTIRSDTARTQDGAAAYVITEAGGSINGWLVPTLSEIEPYPHVNVGVLIVGPSEPPTFPANEVFMFKKVEA